MLDDPIIRRTLITAAVAIPTGYLIGAAYVLGVREPMRETVEVRVQPTDEALLALCEQRMPKGVQGRLQDAVMEIERLEGQLVEKERELSAITATQARSQQEQDQLERRTRRLQAEAEALRVALDRVAEERDELVSELKASLRALDEQVQETERQRASKDRWRSRSVDEAWLRFTAETKNRLCDRGTRRRLERCETHLDTFFHESNLQPSFRQCLLTRQAVPSLGTLPNPDAPLPAHARPIPDDRSLPGRGHYIVLCDPTLPEAAPTASPGGTSPTLTAGRPDDP